MDTSSTRRGSVLDVARGLFATSTRVGGEDDSIPPLEVPSIRSGALRPGNRRGFRAPRGRRVHQESRCYQPSYEVPGSRREAIETSSTYERPRTTATRFLPSTGRGLRGARPVGPSAHTRRLGVVTSCVVVREVDLIWCKARSPKGPLSTHNSQLFLSKADIQRMRTHCRGHWRLLYVNSAVECVIYATS
jgi:hypothetical protein